MPTSLCAQTVEEEERRGWMVVMFYTTDFLFDQILSKIGAGIGNTDPIAIRGWGGWGAGVFIYSF